MRCPGCTCLHRARGPRRIDSHQRAQVTEGTTRRYQLALQGFTDFALREFPYIATAEDFDDAVMEYKQSKTLTKSEFENLIAALEHARPSLRRQLP